MISNVQQEPLYSLYAVNGIKNKHGLNELKIVKETRLNYDPAQSLSNSSALADFVYNLFKDTDDVEYMLCIPLNQQNVPIGYHIVSKGTVNECTAMPRDIFRAAVMLNATAIVMAHTHPSGNCEPSEVDRALTKRLVDAGEIIGIRVLDHVVVGMGKDVTYKSVIY